MAPFSKPEAVLKQAEHLIAVHQEPAALQQLSETITSKKFRTTTLATLEPVMLLFLNLCVNMRKGRVAKEGLMQYKNIAQNSSVASVEMVVKRFIQLAEEKVTTSKAAADKLYDERMAAQKADKETGEEKEDGAEVPDIVEVEDLEASETPERVLMGAVLGGSGESKERMDRALVTPWLKYLWEAYRTALETLKNNARLEIIYQQVAQMAFQFCLQFQRKTEFRRLCDLLRLHLTTASKYSHQPHSINLADPDTLQRHLDTRFAQLDAAIEMELWGEAFRSVEDVHHLLTLTTAAPPPSTTAGAAAPAAASTKKPSNLKQLSLYYEKLTKVFAPSSSSTISSADTSLFHAAAYARYFASLRTLPNNGGKTAEEMEVIAGGVVLSALCVREEAAQEARTEEEDPRKGGREGRLAGLLGLNRLPTRRGMLKEAVTRGILSLCSAPIKQLHALLTTPLSPHTIAQDSVPLLTTLSDKEKYPAFTAYVPLLPSTLLTHLLLSLSESYSEIFLDSLLAMVDAWKGTEWEITSEAVEGWLMGLFRRTVIRGRVDHARGVVLFEDAEPGGGAGDELQNIATKLETVLAWIDPPPAPTDEASPIYQAVKAAVAALPTTRAELAHKRALQQRRAELSLELTTRRTKEEAQSRLDKQRAEKEEHERREKEETKRREQERIKREIESVRKGEQQKLVQELIAKGGLKVPVEDMDNLDHTKLVQLQVEQIEKQKKDLNDRLRIIAKRMDHVERAFRKEERPMLEEDYIKQQEEDRIAFESTAEELRKRAREQFEEDLNAKQRLSRMLGDYKAMKAVFEERKKDEFERKAAEAKTAMEKEKAARRKQVLKEREEERKAREEEERRAREEEEEARRAEEERIAAEEAREAEEATKREAAEAARKQRAEEREREIAAAKKRVEEEEARERAREERRRAGKAAPPTPAVAVAEKVAPAAAVEAGVWRRGGAARPSTPVNPSSRESPRDSPSRAIPSRESPRAEPGSAMARGPDGRPMLKLAPRSSAPTRPSSSGGPRDEPSPKPSQEADGARDGGRPTMKLAPRTVPKDDTPAPSPKPREEPVRPPPAASPKPLPPLKKEAPATDDDGFTTVKPPEKWTRGGWRGRGRGGAA